MDSIGRLRIRRELARGGMGVVYLGHDPRSGREVAVKLLLPSARASTRKRFAREGQALTRLAHPGVVEVLEVGEHHGSPYLVMELIEGETLQARLDREGPLPVAEAVAIARQLADALEHAHRQGVLHRDLKPANVMLGRGGRPQLTDFGLTRDLQPLSPQSLLTEDGAMLGTPGYWAPEQARGDADAAGPPADVYGLAATLVAALTGAPPHGEVTTFVEAAERLASAPPPPSRRRPEVPPTLDAVCLRGLAIDPGERYPSAGAFAAALDAALAAPAAPAPRSWIWGPIAVALAFAAAFSVAALRPRGEVPALAGPPPGPPPTAPVEASDPGEGDPELLAAERELTQGQRLLASGEFRRAIAYFDRAIELAPTGLAYHQRAAAYSELGDFVRADADYTAALELLPAPPTYAARGRVRVALGRFDDAEADFARAVERAPQLTLAHALWSRLRARRGDFSGAIEHVSDAIRVGRTAPPEERGQLFAERAAFRLRLSDHAGALEDIRQAVALVPESPRYQADLAAALGFAGAFDEAERAAVRALDCGPEPELEARILGELAVIRIRAGRDDEALELLARGIALQPRHTELRFVRAELLLKRGDYERALEDLLITLSAEPPHPRTLALYGAILLGLGDYAAARDQFAAAIQASPRDGVLHYNMGNALIGMGERGSAQRAWTRALELAPRAKWAIKAQAKLAALGRGETPTPN